MKRWVAYRYTVIGSVSGWRRLEGRAQRMIHAERSQNVALALFLLLLLQCSLCCLFEHLSNALKLNLLGLESSKLLSCFTDSRKFFSSKKSNLKTTTAAVNKTDRIVHLPRRQTLEDTCLPSLIMSLHLMTFLTISASSLIAGYTIQMTSLRWGTFLTRFICERRNKRKVRCFESPRTGKRGREEGKK